MIIYELSESSDGNMFVKVTACQGLHKLGWCVVFFSFVINRAGKWPALGLGLRYCRNLIVTTIYQKTSRMTAQG